MMPNAGPAGAPYCAKHAHSAIESVTEQWGGDVQLRAYSAFTSSITGVASAYNTHNIHAINRNTNHILVLPYLQNNLSYSTSAEQYLNPRCTISELEA